MRIRFDNAQTCATLPGNMSKNPTDTVEMVPVAKGRKLRLRDAAAYLGVSHSTMRRLIAQGRIGVESLGYRTKFVYLSELDAFSKQQHK